MRKKILSPKYLKSQNQISDAVKHQSIKAIQEWLKCYPAREAYLLAEELFSLAYSSQVAGTADSAAEILLLDKDKAERLIASAQKIAEELDSRDELDVLADELADRDGRLGEGNSI